MIQRRAIASTCLLLLFVCALNAQTTALDEGVQLIREGHFSEALAKLEQAHRIAPNNPTIENLLGITETQLGHLDEANHHYREAIRLEPSQAAPHRNLGFNLLSARDYSQAALQLHEAVRLEPKDPFGHYYLLLLALATNKDAETTEEASAAGQLLDNDPAVAADVVEADIRTGHADDAGARIERLEKSHQITVAQEYQIAVLFSRHGYFSQSLRCFRQIASFNPSWENRYNLALAELYAGQSSEAATLLEALHSERPANADTLTFLGAADELQQKMPEALEAYRAAVAADPSNPDRMLDYTRLLMDTDRYDEAIQMVQAGMAKTSAAAPLQLRLGAIEMIQGKYTEARTAFDAALASDPELDVAYVGLAQTYARQANDAEALRILETAREKMPGHYLLEYYFGLLASRLGRGQEAIVALKRASEVEPKSPDPYFELGKLYASQQDWPHAREAFEHVAKLNPRYLPAHYQLSRVYEHLGLRSQAEQEAQQTRILVNAQRDEVLRRQQERAQSFLPQPNDPPRH